MFVPKTNIKNEKLLEICHIIRQAAKAKKLFLLFSAPNFHYSRRHICGDTVLELSGRFSSASTTGEFPAPIRFFRVFATF